jgi:hypothetical protein
MRPDRQSLRRGFGFANQPDRIRRGIVPILQPEDAWAVTLDGQPLHFSVAVVDSVEINPC